MRRKFCVPIVAGTTAMVLAILVLVIPRPVRAQTDSPDASSPPTSGPPVVTSGCYQGMVFNDAQGTGTISFLFEIKKNKIIKSGSMYIINYDEGLNEMSPISGKVNSTQFKWKGKAVGNQSSQCAIAGVGHAVSNAAFLDGSYTYAGKCTEVSNPHNPFTGGDFSKLEFVGATCP